MKTLKTLLVLAVLGLSSVSFAAAECPAGTDLAITCKPSPQAGDGQFAADMLDSLAVCKTGAVTSIIVQKEGESSGGEVAVQSRIGADVYSVDDGASIFTLAVVTGTAGPQIKATFSITFKDVKDALGNPVVSSANYACSRE